jgi:hypothetical protein
MAATDGAPGGVAAPAAAAWQRPRSRRTARQRDALSKARRQGGGRGRGARAHVRADALSPEGTEAARYVDADASPPVLRDAPHRGRVHRALRPLAAAQWRGSVFVHNTNYYSSCLTKR